ncbi:MAG: hypothetical protein ACRC7S_05530 [Cetobacterium sp.]
MIKIIAFNKITGKEYKSSELNYITFIDDYGVLRGMQSYIGLKLEISEDEDDDEK